MKLNYPSRRRCPLAALSAVGLLLCTAPGFAVLTFVDAVDDPQHCDPLLVPPAVHEIGWGAASGGPFPPNEELASRDLGLGNPPCPVHDIPGVPDPIVEITNLTGQDWAEIWYVPDDETTLTNWDGFVFAGGSLPTFRDRLHRPEQRNAALVGKYPGRP